MPGRLAALLGAGCVCLGATSLVVAPTAQGVPATGTAPDVDPDPSDRDSMRLGWTLSLEPLVQWFPGEISDLPRCEEGSASDEMVQATMTVLNFARAVVGVQPVIASPSLSARAQKAAMMISFSHDLSHQPAETSPCWSVEGAEAAGRSLLSTDFGARAVLANLSSSDDRPWVLDPRQTQVGVGAFMRFDWDYWPTGSALYVRDDASFQPVPEGTPSYLAWPAAGYLPIQIEPGGSWSVSSTDLATDFSDATVTVNGLTSGVTVQRPTTGDALPTLGWSFDPAFQPGDPDRSYDIVVSGALRHGRPVRPYAYTVTLFDAEDPPVVTAHQRPFAVLLDDRFRASFSATDQDGVAELEETIMRWHAMSGTRDYEISGWIAGDSISDTVEPLTAGDTTCVSVQARDGIGELSRQGMPETCRHTPVDDTSLVASDGWTSVPAPRFWHGTALVTDRRDALLRSAPVVNVTRLGVVATTCPSCGTVDVFTAGRHRGSLSLRSARTKHQQVLMLPQLSRFASGRVQLVVRSTGKKVQIDGLVVS